MKIGVCAKVTPDADARIKIAANGTGIDPAGVKFVVSDYDGYAVEEAIRTKEAHGGEVVSFTVGAGSDDKLIRGGALAVGVDRAVLITGDDAEAGAGSVQQAPVEFAEDRRHFPPVVIGDDDVLHAEPVHVCVQCAESLLLKVVCYKGAHIFHQLCNIACLASWRSCHVQDFFARLWRHRHAREEGARRLENVVSS